MKGALAVAALFAFACDEVVAPATAAPADAGPIVEDQRQKKTTPLPTPTPEIVVAHIADLISRKLGAKDYADALKRASPDVRKEMATSTARTLASTRNLKAVSPRLYRDYASCVMAAETHEAQVRCDKALQEAADRFAPSLSNP